MDGIVCSPVEAEMVRKAIGRDMLIVTPGVRPADASLGDQKRVMNPAKAIAAGADYLVVGRPVTAATDPVDAAARIVREIEDAL
jgi:orotidine-5'-phosphate decarboxylase